VLAEFGERLGNLSAERGAGLNRAISPKISPGPRTAPCAAEVTPMFLTVTLNAAVDKTWRLGELVPGRLHRPDEAVSLAGGKGINVARVLHALAGSDVPHAGLIAVCEDTSVLGDAVFYLMEPVAGFNAGAGLPALHAGDAAIRHGMGLSMADENFASIVMKPDNVPIVGLVFLLAFFTWLAF